MGITLDTSNSATDRQRDIGKFWKRKNSSTELHIFLSNSSFDGQNSDWSRKKDSRNRIKKVKMRVRVAFQP